MYIHYNLHISTCTSWDGALTHVSTSPWRCSASTSSGWGWWCCFLAVIYDFFEGQLSFVSSLFTSDFFPAVVLIVASTACWWSRLSSRSWSNSLSDSSLSLICGKVQARQEKPDTVTSESPLCMNPSWPWYDSEPYVFEERGSLPSLNNCHCETTLLIFCSCSPMFLTT